MRKAEFIALAAGKAKLTNKQTEQAYDAIIAQMIELLNKDIDVSFIGFGGFKVVTRAARKGRNPQDGSVIELPERKKVKFIPSYKLLKK